MSDQQRLFGMVTLQSSTEYTLHALASFFRHTPLKSTDQIILIDNDGHFPRDQIASYPQLKLHVNSKPLSFGHNGNQLLQWAKQQQADLYFLNNDLIFTPNWLQPLVDCAPDRIALPISNMQIEYSINQWKVQKFLDLEDYKGHEAEIEGLAAHHATLHQGELPVFYAYFYCVKIPLSVQNRIGVFDERFDASGGEDLDYCLRAHLAGLQVVLAKASYILHFQGKSTWRGPESELAAKQRTQRIHAQFTGKWGQDLYDLIAFQNLDVFRKYPEQLRQEFDEQKYSRVIEAFKPKSL